MSRAELRTLLYPFEVEALTAPAAGERVLFLGAEPGFVPPEDFGATIDCVQGFRPQFLALAREGRNVAPNVEGDGYDAALVLASRHRAENETRFAEAIRRVRPGGLVVMAGGREDGVAALRERLEKNRDRLAEALKGQHAQPPIVKRSGGRVERNEPPERRYHYLKAPVPLGGHLSKSHGVVFWLARTPEADAYAAQAIEWHGGRPLTAGRFRTAPSSFSHDRVDAGSKLLADCLPASLDGVVADFCAGWGYLAVEVAARGARRVDLYEADHASLEAARDNMARLAAGTPARFFWHDLVGEPVAERYDAIVMNPPFHQSRAADPSLGAALIVAAAKATRKGGRLFLVANRQLPYEAPLAKSFLRVEKLREEAGFKVFCAVR